MADRQKCTRPPRPPQSPPCCQGSAEDEPPLEKRAEAALKRISRYPAALDPTPERRARWLSATAKLAGAAADFAVLAAEGEEDSYMEAAAIGDALLAGRSQEAARSVLETQREIGNIGWFEIKAAWESYGESLASGDSAGDEGQRLLVAIAEKLQARFGC